MRQKTTPVFTPEEEVNRLWDATDITDLIARHSLYYSNDWRRQELADLWVQEPDHRRTASLGVNNGWYVGMEEIARHYVVDAEAQRYAQLQAFADADPSIKVCKDNLGKGISCFHTCNTPLVFVADDGKTARYLGCDIGHQTYGKPGNTADAQHVIGRVFADVILENGQWKIWHLVLEHEYTIAAGTDYGSYPLHLKPGDDPIESENGQPTIQETVHDPFYNWEYMYHDMPRPYRTYTDKHGYGPESDLNLPYDIREERY
jgi:hypothetical protein